MGNWIYNLLNNATNRLVSAVKLQNRVRLRPRPASISSFDAESECLFWRERYGETLNTLKIALLLGATGLLGCAVLAFFNGGVSALETFVRLSVIFSLLMLLLYVQRHPQPQTQIARVAKIGAYLSVANLVGILLLEKNPQFYADTWVGLLPIYFFSYGQMFMTTVETLKLGLLAMIALPLTGYAIGVENIALLPSILILSTVNAFGFCTRCQLEAHARNLFHERRNAERATENKTLFLRQLSHNLRQPLQALSCYSSILDAGFENRTDDPMQKMVGKLGSAIDELNNAVNHILGVANLESGRQLPLLTAVDINILLAALEDQFAPQAAKRGLRLKVHLRSRPPYLVNSDACILSQIISNLIDNAIKYTANGWVLVETVRIAGNHLKLHIRDSGIGIAEQQKQNIFKEFYRGHRRREDPHVHGLGIGLAYVLKALEHLPDHTLDVYSVPDRGSDFQLRLPVAAVTPECKKATGDSDTDFAGSFVFVVDDDPEVLDALAEQLTVWGCLVEKIGSKAEVLSALAEIQRPPDLLITDFYLQDNETAHDIIAAIVADCGPVPTLVLSAHAITTEDKARLPEKTLLLRKPTSADALMETITKALA